MSEREKLERMAVARRAVAGTGASLAGAAAGLLTAERGRAIWDALPAHDLSKVASVLAWRCRAPICLADDTLGPRSS